MCGVINVTIHMRQLAEILYMKFEILLVVLVNRMDLIASSF